MSLLISFGMVGIVVLFDGVWDGGWWIFLLFVSSRNRDLRDEDVRKLEVKVE